MIPDTSHASGSHYDATASAESRQNPQQDFYKARSSLINCHAEHGEVLASGVASNNLVVGEVKSTLIMFIRFDEWTKQADLSAEEVAEEWTGTANILRQIYRIRETDAQ